MTLLLVEMPFVTSSFLLLSLGQEPLLASLLLIANYIRPFFLVFF